ncbi:MAG: putative DNA binding domain-containing protein [Gammaproteobacteria bacterium]|nr:putative DNA binding domain-containing protein [Gammaproteobacteria bacterium]
MSSNTLEDKLHKLLSQQENIRLEFKEARQALPANLFETICAMLNRDGGDIFLGVNDQGQILGIAPEQVESIKDNLTSLSNNPQKLNPPFILFANDHVIDGHTILHIQVPASSQVHRSAGIVFDRANDGDFRVAEPLRIAELSNRKRQTYTEDRIYPAIRMQDLRLDLLPKCRNLMLSRSNHHPWLQLSDEQLLHKAGLYLRDWESNKEGYTLAAVLLLGTDEMIHSILPHYKIDALLRVEQLDRYDDRETLYCNLIEAYPRLLDFIAKHLPDPFYLEGLARISLRDKIFREVIANFLVHREYTSAYPARLIIYKDRVETSNASNGRFAGPIESTEVVPFPRNPTISKFFAQLAWVDELGSGMINIDKYLPLYTPGAQAQYKDGSVYSTLIPLKAEIEPTAEVTMEVTTEVRQLISHLHGEMSRQELQLSLAFKNDEHFRLTYLQPALSANVIEMTLADKPNSRLQKYRLTEIGKQLVRIPLKAEITPTTEVTMEVTAEVTTEVKQLISHLHSEMSRQELQLSLALKNDEHFRLNYLQPALIAGVVEMTMPDKPNSRLQKYRLTEMGKQLQRNIKNNMN